MTTPARPADGLMGTRGWLTCGHCGSTWHPDGTTHRCHRVTAFWPYVVALTAITSGAAALITAAALP